MPKSSLRLAAPLVLLAGLVAPAACSDGASPAAIRAAGARPAGLGNGPPGGDPAGDPGGDPDSSGPFPRAGRGWWMRQRAYPGGSIPTGVYRAARDAVKGLSAKAKHHAGPPDGPGPPPPPPPAWEPIGPAPLVTAGGLTDAANMSPTTGRASAIAIDPSAPKTLLAGFALGGIWKSLDGGATWAAKTDDAASMAIASIAIDPKNPKKMYAGTGSGDLFSGYFGQGLLVSVDGGDSWSIKAADVFAGLSISRVVVDPGDGSIYVSADFGDVGKGDYCTASVADAPGQGLYRSTNEGLSFQSVRGGSLTDFELDASVTPRTLFVAEWGYGVSRSVDGGVTWDAPAGLPASPDRIELAIAPSDPSIVYAGVAAGAGGELYRSVDHGATFEQVNGAPAYCDTQCDYDNVVAVKPDDPATVYLGGELCAVWKTTNALDAAPTFTAVTMPNGDCGSGSANWPEGYVHPDVHALTFAPGSPDTLYVGSDGGVTRTIDGGANWSRLNGGVAAVQLYALCADPSSKNGVYGGAQDNGLFHRTQASLKWNAVETGDGTGCALDPTNPLNVLLATQYGSTVVTKSGFKADADLSFETQPPCGGMNGCGDRVGFTPPLVADPTQAATFYIGTYRLWRTTEGGKKKTWKAISADLTRGTQSIGCITNFFGFGDDYLTAIAVAPSTSSTIYTGSASGQISVTFDGGTTWANVDADVPDRYVSGLVVDPRDDKRVFVGLSGFDANTPGHGGHVFESGDGGKTWTKRDIPADTPVDTLLGHPVASGLLYAGTDVGALVSSDGGVSWRALGTGLPATAVYSMSLRTTSSSLLAGTYGRSAWELHFAGGLAASPLSLELHATVGQAAAQGTLDALDTDDLGSVVDVAASADEPWITLSPSSGLAAGQTPVAITVGAASESLAAGTYDAKITLVSKAGAGATLEVPLHLVVEKPLPKIVLGPPPNEPPPLELGGGCDCGLADGSSPAGSLGAIGVALGALFALRSRRSERRRA